MKITAIRLDRMRLPLDPPFHAAWDPDPRRHFDATRRLPAYASFGEARSPQDRAQAALAAKAVGFKAMKIRISRTEPGACVQAVQATGWTEQRRDFFLTDPVRIDTDGYLTVPDTPGLGAEIDESAVTRWRIP